MFALGIFRNDFPPEYHPDEPSKVEQLADGTRNDHHPPLMLTLADAAADLGTLPELRARRIGYVVVCRYDSRRHVDARKHPGPDARDFLRRRDFYESLPAHARSPWKSELRQPFPLRPGLELFALDPRE